MAQFKSIISSILKDCISTQHEADIFSVSMSEEYAGNGRTGSFPLPGVKFTELWTRKESFLKLTGEGLKDNLKDVLSNANDVTFTTGINRSACHIHSVAIWEEKHPTRLYDEHQKNIKSNL